MHLVRRFEAELKVNTTCGASNVSFGLPQRNGINAAFLTMAIGAGMTSAITNPLHEEIVRVHDDDVMMGHDPDCMRWIRKFREVVRGREMGRGRREVRKAAARVSSLRGGSTAWPAARGFAAGACHPKPAANPRAAGGATPAHRGDESAPPRKRVYPIAAGA